MTVEKIKKHLDAREIELENEIQDLRELYLGQEEWERNILSNMIRSHQMLLAENKHLQELITKKQ